MANEKSKIDALSDFGNIYNFKKDFNILIHLMKLR